ncbi:hypothetical protein RCL1_003349 [Eukaryota sp. TZLM3-RCL]
MCDPLSKAEVLPLFKDVPIADRQALLLKKLALISTPYEDHSGSVSQYGLKEKSKAVQDVLVFLSDSRSSPFTTTAISSFIKMISHHIFRFLRTSNTLIGLSDPKCDARWKSRQPYYDMLLRFVLSPDLDVKLAKKYLNSFFLSNFLLLFDTEDARERDFLKTVLHRIYAKFMPHRTFIRRSMLNMLLEFLYEEPKAGTKFKGVSEFLEIFGSIINGFALPLKPDHVTLLNSVLLPLFTSPTMPSFQSPLIYCVTQFVEKDPSLCYSVISKLTKWWPKTNAARQIYYITCLEDLLPNLPNREQSVLVPLIIDRLSDCVKSEHFQVAEKALLFLGSHHAVSIIPDQPHQVTFTVFDAIYSASKEHWNQSIVSLATETLRLYMEVDPEGFLSSADSYKKKKKLHKSRAQAKHDDNWLFIERTAKENMKSSQLFDSAVSLLDEPVNDENDTQKKTLKWCGSVSTLHVDASSEDVTIKPIIVVPTEQAEEQSLTSSNVGSRMRNRLSSEDMTSFLHGSPSLRRSRRTSVDHNVQSRVVSLDTSDVNATREVSELISSSKFSIS